MSIYYEPGTEGLTDPTHPTHHLQAALEAVAETARKLKEERDEARREQSSIQCAFEDSQDKIEQLERERDEAREALAAAKHYLTKERDDALAQIVQAECRAERFCQERDEARERAAKLAAQLLTEMESAK